MADKNLDQLNLTGGSKMGLESAHILPGELRDNVLVQQSYASLNQRLERDLSFLKGKDASKHYFHSQQGNRLTHEGGKEIEITITGPTTKTVFNSREKFDDSDPKALNYVDAVSMILNSDIVTGKQNIDLVFFRNGKKHTWKANADNHEYQIQDQQSDINSLDLADVLSQIETDCFILLANPQNVKSLDKPPAISGLPMMPDKKSQARWN